VKIVSSIPVSFTAVALYQPRHIWRQTSQQRRSPCRIQLLTDSPNLSQTCPTSQRITQHLTDSPNFSQTNPTSLGPPAPTSSPNLSQTLLTSHRLNHPHPTTTNIYQFPCKYTSREIKSIHRDKRALGILAFFEVFFRLPKNRSFSILKKIGCLPSSKG
jgi:hypothetical protein